LSRSPKPPTHGAGRGNEDPDERHRVAVAQSLRWAQESATRGDYVSALARIRALEAIGDQLPQEFQLKRLAWIAALAERSASVEQS
jgi:hypothetical protein